MSYTTSSASTNYPNVRTVATPTPSVGSVIELFNANATATGAALDALHNTATTTYYIHFAFSVDAPLADADMHTTRTASDTYLGVYRGTSATAPTTYGSYEWFKAVGSDGTNGTNGTNGVGYSSASINGSGELVLTKTDGTTANVGVVKGATGATGPAGETGPTGPTGATGAQGPAGADAEVSWTISTDNNSTSCSFATVNGTMKIFGNSAITALTLTAGSGWAAGHCSAVRFFSPSTAATITAPSGWVFKGDACASSVFTPEASKAYLLTILHDSVETLVTVLEVA